MAILITGGSGFVGLNLIQRLLEGDAAVMNYSLSPPPEAAQRHFATLPGTLRNVAGDVLDSDAVERMFGEHAVESVIHAAVITADAERERREAARIVAVNVQGTVNVLEAARSRGVRRFLYVSSGAVYGRSGFSAAELDEEGTAPNPESLYGISKYAAERICLRYRTISAMDVVAARLGAVYGRWEYDTGQRDTLSGPFLATRLAVAGGEAVLSHSGRRDWIYAPDVAEGLLSLLNLPAHRHEVYHVASGREWTMEGWCERLRQRYPAFRYRIAEQAQAHAVNVQAAPLRAPLSPRRLREESGFSARYGLEEALADYLDWLERYPL